MNENYRKACQLIHVDRVEKVANPFAYRQGLSTL